MAPEITAGNSTTWASAKEVLLSSRFTSAHWPTFKLSGLLTPPGPTTRNSRGTSEASEVAVTRKTNRFSSFDGAGSARVMPPALDSTVTVGLAGAGPAGTFVAESPGSPLNRISVIGPRFSPLNTSSRVVPRWIHSGEMEASLGAGWAHRSATSSSKAVTNKECLMKIRDVPTSGVPLSGLSAFRFPLFSPRFSPEQAGHRLCLHQLAGLIQVI